MSCRTQNLIIHQLEKELAKLLKEKSNKGPDIIEALLTKETLIFYFKGFLTNMEELIMQAGYPEKVHESRIIAFNQYVGEIEAICQRLLNKRINQIFPSFVPEKDMGCFTIFIE